MAADLINYFYIVSLNYDTFQTSALINSAVVNKLFFYQHESQQPRKSISTSKLVISSLANWYILHIFLQG